MMNQDMLDTLTFVSFIMGVANYNEKELQKSLEEQNNMLKEIIRRID